MKRERCFGIIPLTYRKGLWEAFIIEHAKGNYWGFPKGHGEEGESPKESARRELREETGMAVIRYLPHPCLRQIYQFERDGKLIEKKVQFYLAEVTPNYEIHSREVIRGKWVILKHLFSYVKFKEEEELFREVIQLLGN